MLQFVRCTFVLRPRRSTYSSTMLLTPELIALFVGLLGKDNAGLK